MSAEDSRETGSIIWKDLSLILKDGTKLSSRIWHPQEGGPWPALLMRQPYGRALASTVTYAHPHWWASNGYLVIIQDVRGQGDSEGEFKGFSQEASDTTETHHWARSLPECNGRLGTFGFSYQGFTQLIAEKGAPPPDCMAPAMTGFDESVHWSREGGAFWWHLGMAWGIQLASLKARREKNYLAWETLRNSLIDGSYLYEGERLLKRNDPQGMILKWLEQSKEASKKSLVHHPLKSWLRKPMLLIGGLWDPHLKGILDIYKLSTQAGGKPQIHIGPSTHLNWWDEANQLQLNFFNQHLYEKEKENIIEGKDLIWNVTTRGWQEIEEPRTSESLEKTVWSLSSNGLACVDKKDGVLSKEGNGEGMVSIVHDPWRPVPSIGGHLSPIPGLAERSDIDSRNDVATFSTAKLRNNLHIEGIPYLTLDVHSDQSGFDLCVALSIVNANDKEVTQISTGVYRALGEDALQPATREVVMHPLCADICSGQKLRISISGAAWPAIGVNPGDTCEEIGPPSAKCNVITLILDLTHSKLKFSPLLLDN